MSTRRSRPRRHLASSPFAAQPAKVIETFEVDDRITHDKYGLGRVVSVEEGAVTVDFGSSVVRIPSPFSRLSKL